MLLCLGFTVSPLEASSQTLTVMSSNATKARIRMTVLPR